MTCTGEEIKKARKNQNLSRNFWQKFCTKKKHCPVREDRLHSQFTSSSRTVRSKMSEEDAGNTVVQSTLNSCGGRKERHVDLLLKALSGPSTEEKDGDFLEVRGLGGAHLFPRLPLLLFSPLVQALLLQQQQSDPTLGTKCPVIVLPELPLVSLQALSQLVLTGKSSLVCPISEVKSAALALGIEMEHLVKVKTEASLNSSQVENVEESSSGAARGDLEEDFEEVDEADGSSTDFNQVMDALDKEIKKELVNEEDLNRTSSDLSPGTTRGESVNEHGLSLKTEPKSDLDSDETGGDSEFANVLKALDQESDNEKNFENNLEAIDEETVGCSNDVGFEEDMLDIPPESESGRTENFANDKQGCGDKITVEEIDAQDQGNIEDALEEPVYSGMCYISTEASDFEDTDSDKEFEEQNETVDDISEDIVDDISQDIVDDISEDFVDDISQDIVDDISEDIDDQDNTLHHELEGGKEAKKRLVVMEQEWSEMEDNEREEEKESEMEDNEKVEEAECESEKGSVNEKGSPKRGKTGKDRRKEIENRENREKETGNSETVEESEKEKEQKLKMLERASRGARQGKAGEDLKPKRKTWREEMKLLKERFEEEREVADLTMDEKSTFLRALNLTAKILPEVLPEELQEILPELQEELQEVLPELSEEVLPEFPEVPKEDLTEDVNLGSSKRQSSDENLRKKRDRSKHSKDKKVVQKEKESTNRENLSPSKRRRKNHEQKVEEIVEDGDIASRDELGLEDCLIPGKEKSRESENNQEPELESNLLDVSLEVQPEQNVPENLKDMVGEADIMDNQLGEVRECGEELGKPDDKPKGEEALQKEGEQDEKEEKTGKKVKVELRPALPDIMTIEEIDLEEFDTARYL